MAAKLYVVATPIGNLADISQRAIEVLSAVDLIACEDTRHSQKLLSHLQVKTPMLSLHEHNESQRISQIIAQLEQGSDVALISDAGTPLISDPGFVLVREVQAKGIAIVPVPGACAVIAALSVAGLPTDRFVFEGFLPAKTLARKNQLETFKNETRTVVFYEAPHRIEACIADCAEVFGGDREVVLAKELTKTFEQIVRLSLQEMLQWLAQNPDKIKGEFVVLLRGVDAAAETELSTEILEVLQDLLAELPLKQAVKLAEKITKKPKNALYEAALSLKK